jgi:hypothetical protein
MTSLAKSIFIVGTGRCGSTVFQRLLASHPDVMWLSGVCDRFPRRPEWNRRVVEAVSNPLLRPLLRSRVRPGEFYRFWETHARGYAAPCRDLVRQDVTARTKQQVRSAFRPMLTGSRNRLLVKITGWPRIGFLDEIFEDARFIHIVRDGRAVASSLLHVNFWRGWYGPQGWRAGLLSPEDQATWESYDRSFVALAGLEWRIQMRAIEAARRTLDPGRYLEVKFEEFCSQPQDTVRQVLSFAELPDSDVVQRRLGEISLKDMSNRWRDDLTPAQQILLNDLLADDLARHGYSVSPPEAAQTDPFDAMAQETTSQP